MTSKAAVGIKGVFDVIYFALEDLDYVEADYIIVAVLALVKPCRAEIQPLFLGGDSLFGQTEIVVHPRLDLDEGDDFAAPCYDINLAKGCAHVAPQNFIALSFEISGGGFFALSA